MSNYLPFDRGLRPKRLRISVIVPTFCEVDNIRPLVVRLGSVARKHDFQLELILVDDDSQDGTVELVRQLNLDWVRLVERRGPRGLSQSVVEGLRQSSYELLVVMDADLSHPPEVLPQMITALEEGHEIVFGSRYITGATTDEAWGVLRRCNSAVATWLARPLTDIRDPLSGFFALRRQTYAKVVDVLAPIGYKIGLELIVKCDCPKAGEVPIHFAKRQHGVSKLSLAEQCKYLRHLSRLYTYRLRRWRKQPTDHRNLS